MAISDKDWHDHTAPLTNEDLARRLSNVELQLMNLADRVNAGLASIVIMLSAVLYKLFSA